MTLRLSASTSAVVGVKTPDRWGLVSGLTAARDEVVDMQPTLGVGRDHKIRHVADFNARRWLRRCRRETADWSFAGCAIRGFVRCGARGTAAGRSRDWSS